MSVDELPDDIHVDLFAFDNEFAGQWVCVDQAVLRVDVLRTTDYASSWEDDLKTILACDICYLKQ